MSYDYNALVASIVAHRRQASEDDDDAATHLQQAIDTFATLSSHCPMTPLLWMQYAHDTSRLLKLVMPNESAVDMRLQTLELGLAEFPGCALLRLHYLQLLVEACMDDVNKVETAFQDALAAVGRGSHRNEGHLVAAIYRLYATFLASQQKPVIDVFVQRAKTPMKDANDSLVSEVQEFCQAHNVTLTTDDLQRIEDARRWTAKTFDTLAVNEDDVDVAMHAEGILTRHEYAHDDIDWETLLKSEGGRLWMGCGGTQTATAFLNYAQACSYYKVPRHEYKEDEEAAKQKLEIVHSLALAIYERGVAECPTVESLWLPYIRQIMYLVSINSPLVSAARLESVVSRAARNCPYSVQILQVQIQTALVLAEAGHAVFDPDLLTSIVENAINSKFLPNPASQLELHMAAIRTVKRRIMTLLAQSDNKYDDAKEQDGKKEKAVDAVDDEELDEATEQEVQDLVEDLREMYETADSFMRKNHTSWSEGRTTLWKDRAMTETYLLGPLLASLEDSGDNNVGEGLRCFDKLVKVHQPPHPDSYAMYIREFMNQPTKSPRQVLTKLQTTRSLFQKALKAVGKQKEATEASVSHRDRMTALQCLCYDYLDFEQLFGSDESYTQASKDVKRKFDAIVTSEGHPIETKVGNVTTSEENGATAAADTESKRRRSENGSYEPATKKAKLSVSADDVVMEDLTAKETTVSPAENKPKKKHAHTVHVGKLDYPAHPFTVRVSNLSEQTEDMDLVDLFRSKCGAVVHAKIVREKHQRKGKSKGWGLVQFEDRESVEKALALNDVIGIHEHLVKVDRSHVPAVGLVPPGMHRMNPRGEGKSSKRNMKRKERKMSETDGCAEDAIDGDGGKLKQEASKPKASDSAGILAFRPRGVAHGNAHRKVKLSLGSKDESKD